MNKHNHKCPGHGRNHAMDDNHPRSHSSGKCRRGHGAADWEPGAAEDAELTLEQKLLAQLRACHHLLSRRGGRGHGGQTRILHILQKRGEMTQRELLDILQISSASLSEILGKIESKGFIQRRPNQDDKRSVDILLTDQGRQWVQQTRNRQQADVPQLFAQLNQGEKEQLLALLTRLSTGWAKLEQEPEAPHHGDETAE